MKMAVVILVFTFAFAYMGCDDNSGKDRKKYTLLTLVFSSGGGLTYTGGGPTYTVIYNGNGNTSGSVPIDSTSYQQGQSVKALAISGGIVKNAGGYPFHGWNTAANGSGTEYTAGSTFLMGSANVTLYAQYFYAIGDIGPSGVGIVFDVTNGGLNGLEAAPPLWNAGSPDPTSAWITGGSTQTTANGHTQTGIGTGSANTDAIIAQSGETGSAAQICRDYTGGGKTDWFLPSYFELLDLHSQQAVVGGFANIGSFYWTSSENGSQAYFVDFLSGSAPSDPKDSTLRVRPIRAF
jgi:hypothetical protein